MAGGGQYTIRVHGVLDDTQIRAQLAAIQKEYGFFGSKAGKGAGAYMASTGKGAKKGAQGMSAYIKGTEKATKSTKQFGQSTIDITKKVIQFGATTAVIRGVTSGMADMVNKTFELDSALTEFKKVSDLSGKGLEKYTEQAFKTGRSVAKTGTEMIQASTEFRKSGFNDQDSMKLGKVAMMFSNIADAELSAGDAAGFITSQIRADYKDISTEADKASMQIIDAINEVSNTQAVSSTDLSMAMSKVGSALEVNNNNYAESLGMVVAGTERMHGQASKVGRGIRTIGANISKLQKESKTLDLQTKDGIKTIDLWDKKTGQVKSTYEVFKEFAGVWDDMTPDQQQALSLEMAGKNQQEVFTSVVGNWKNAEKAAKTATNQIENGGSAIKENAKYLDSMAGHLENLKSAWSEFSNSMVKSEGLKKGMDTLADFLRFLSSDAGHNLLGIAAGLTATYIAAKPLVGLFSRGKAIKDFMVFAGAFGKTEKKLKAGSKTFKGTAKRFNGMSKTFIVQGKKSEKSATSLGKTLAKAFGGGAEGLGLLGAGGLVAGIGLLSVALAKFVPIGKKAEKILADAEYEETVQELEDLKEQYTSVTDEIKKLEKKRDKKGLSAGEEHRLEVLKEEERVLERQIELTKKRNEADYTKKETTPDLSGLEGSTLFQGARDKGLGQTTEQIAQALKIFTELDVKVAEHQNAVMDVAKAYDHWIKTGEGYGDYKKGLDGIQESMQGVKDKQQEWIDQYGSVKDMPAELQKSYKESKNLTDAWDNLVSKGEKLDISKLTDVQWEGLNNNFKEMGDNLGIMYTEAGKVGTINLDQFTSGLMAAGWTADQVYDALGKISEENPEARVTIDGAEVAEKDVDAVLQYLDAVSTADPEATVKVGGTEYSVGQLKLVDGHLETLNGKRVESEVEVEGGEEAAQTTGDIDEHLGSIPEEKVVNISQEGAEATSSSIFTVQGATNALPKSKNVNITETGAKNSKAKIDNVKKSEDSLYNKSVNINATKSGESAWSRLKNLWNSIHSKTVNIHTTRSGSTGKNAHGTRHAKEGMSMVNEAGFEYIRDAQTGDIRVAHGGRRGLTMLGEGDTVYTHGQSLRMRQEAEEELPKFAKGKKGKKKAQEAYNKQRDKIREKYDKAIDDLEYKQDLQHLSDKWLADNMQKKWDAYTKKLKKYNKSKKVKGWTKKYKGFKTTDSLGKKRKQDLNLAKEGAKYDALTEATEREIADAGLGFSIGGKDTAGAYANEGSQSRYLEWAEVEAERKRLSNLKKNKKISEEDYKKYMDDLYHAYVDSQMKMYEADKKTADEMKQILEEQVANQSITWAEYYDYLEQIEEREADKARDKIEEILTNVDWLSKGLEDVANTIKQTADDAGLESKEIHDYLRDLYQDNLDHMMNLYEYGRESYANLKKSMEDYYQSGYLTAKEYYSSVQDLADKTMEKEQERLGKIQDKNNNTYDLARQYVERQINLLEKQNEELDEQNELIELQNDLEKAKVRRIKIYREGIGFVYEQDTEAIKDATKALDTYSKKQDSPELKAWKDILSLFEEQDALAGIKELENLIGMSSTQAFGELGTSLYAWEQYLKENRSNELGMNALLRDMENIKYFEDIFNFLDGNGHVSESTVASYITKNRYASGALSTPAGFARVSEQGYEIGVFGAGDAVIPHNLSRNLLEWGAMSPFEYASATSGDTYAYSFDKLVLPNVQNANDFMRELKNLPNKALQFSGGRM